MVATFSLKSEIQGDTLVATPSQSVRRDSAGSQDEWDEILCKLHDPRVKNLVLDFQLLGDITPETIVAMKRVSEAVARKRGTVSLCHVSAAARRILRFVRMEGRWPIFPSREAIYDKVANKA